MNKNNLNRRIKMLKFIYKITSLAIFLTIASKGAQAGCSTDYCVLNNFYNSGIVDLEKYPEGDRQSVISKMDNVKINKSLLETKKAEILEKAKSVSDLYNKINKSNKRQMEQFKSYKASKDSECAISTKTIIGGLQAIANAARRTRDSFYQNWRQDSESCTPKTSFP